MHVETAIISSCACFVHFLYGQSALGIFWGIHYNPFRTNLQSSPSSVLRDVRKNYRPQDNSQSRDIFCLAQIVMTEYGYALITLHWLNTQRKCNAVMLSVSFVELNNIPFHHNAFYSKSLVLHCFFSSLVQNAIAFLSGKFSKLVNSCTCEGLPAVDYQNCFCTRFQTVN